MTSAERLPYATLAAAAVAVTIFATTLGSSGVTVLGDIGRPLRWACLVALLAIVTVWRVQRRGALQLRRCFVVSAAIFLAILFASALWSVNPRLSVERAVALTLVVVAAALAADAGAARAWAVERLVGGILAGAAAVAFAGVVLVAVDSDAAIRRAAVGVPARFQGIGQSPNTVPLLLALAVPIAVWVALLRRHVLGFALLVLFVGTMAVSASRGALLAAAVGSGIVVALTASSPRRAAMLVTAVAAIFAGVVSVGQIPQPGRAHAVPRAPAPHLRYSNVEAAYPLEDDLGRSLPGRDVEGKRTLLGSSGRVAVWRYTVGQVLDRPVAGYGFGTEDHVFVDRFANFEGNYVENSYLGLLLQIGAAGLAAFLGLIITAVTVARPGFRAGGLTVAALGAAAAGLVAAVVQSYVYSAGNVATLSFWLVVALLAARPGRRA